MEIEDRVRVNGRGRCFASTPRYSPNQAPSRAHARCFEPGAWASPIPKSPEPKPEPELNPNLNPNPTRDQVRS